MTCEELIKELQKYPPKTLVGGFGRDCEIQSVDVMHSDEEQSSENGPFPIISINNVD